MLELRLLIYCLRNSVNKTVRFNGTTVTQGWLTQLWPEGSLVKQYLRLSVYGTLKNCMLVISSQGLSLWDIDADTSMAFVAWGSKYAEDL